MNATTPTPCPYCGANPERPDALCPAHLEEARSAKAGIVLPADPEEADAVAEVQAARAEAVDAERAFLRAKDRLFVAEDRLEALRWNARPAPTFSPATLAAFREEARRGVEVWPVKPVDA